MTGVLYNRNGVSLSRNGGAFTYAGEEPIPREGGAFMYPKQGGSFSYPYRDGLQGQGFLKNKFQHAFRHAGNFAKQTARQAQNSYKRMDKAVKKNPTLGQAARSAGNMAKSKLASAIKSVPGINAGEGGQILQFARQSAQALAKTIEAAKDPKSAATEAKKQLVDTLKKKLGGNENAAETVANDIVKQAQSKLSDNEFAAGTKRAAESDSDVANSNASNQLNNIVSQAAKKPRTQ